MRHEERSERRRSRSPRRDNASDVTGVGSEVREVFGPSYVACNNVPGTPPIRLHWRAAIIPSTPHIGGRDNPRTPPYAPVRPVRPSQSTPV